MQVELTEQDIDTILWALYRAYGSDSSRWDERVLRLLDLRKYLEEKTGGIYGVKSN